MNNVNVLYKNNKDYSVIELIDDSGFQARAIMYKTFFQSASYTGSKRFEMYSKYSNLYDVPSLFNPNIKTSLVLGGGGFSYPKYYINKYPEKTMDVVEIDPEMIKISYDYFYLDEVDENRLNVINEDAFSYIDKCDKKYDSIFVDLYCERDVIYNSITKDTTSKLKKILNDDGILSFNYMLVLGTEDKLRMYVDNLYDSFKYVKAYITDNCFSNEAGNIFIVASNKELSIKPNDIAIELDLDMFLGRKNIQNI